MAVDRIVRNGNSKLGKGIGKVALPAAITCPGKGECVKVCYALKLQRIYKNYDAMLHRHQSLLEKDSAAYRNQVMSDIAHGKYNTVRVHESGDFYSMAQISMWNKIATDLPDVQFYAYTRSWKVPHLKPFLDILKAQPNFSIRASMEPGETVPAGWAWTSIVDKDEDKRPDGGIICHEQTGKKANCKECKVCWKSDATVYFRKH